MGKTYAMLEAAHAAKEHGRDVVVGYIEPHTRPDTLALLDGLEQLPVREIPYKGITLREFDVDAALARKPGLILVDELAHTNAPGSRHAKRYRDVEELLHAGIDVFTTVNVQHLESLNDKVSATTERRYLCRMPYSLRPCCALPPLPKGEVLCVLSGATKAPPFGGAVERSETERVVIFLWAGASAPAP